MASLIPPRSATTPSSPPRWRPPIRAGWPALDPALDDELMIAGRAAWQVLAGAAAGASLRGRLRCALAPYDVSYLVASWEGAAATPGRAALAD